MLRQQAPIVALAVAHADLDALRKSAVGSFLLAKAKRFKFGSQLILKNLGLKLEKNQI